MKHVVKILIALLQAAIIPRSHTWLLPLGCYGLLMVGIGLMHFPTCRREAVLLQHDIAEAKDFLSSNGVYVYLTLWFTSLSEH